MLTVPLLKVMRSQVPVSSSRLSVKWIYQLMIWDSSLILETWNILWERRRELEISKFRNDSTPGNILVWRASRKLIIFWAKRSVGNIAAIEKIWWLEILESFETWKPNMFDLVSDLQTQQRIVWLEGWHTLTISWIWDPIDLSICELIISRT